MIYFLLLVIVAKESLCAKHESASFRGQNSSCSPVDCKLNHWSLWSECSESCLGIPGHQTRLRTQLQAPSCHGLPCPALKETRSCVGDICMNDGVLNIQGKCLCREGYTGVCCNDRGKITRTNEALKYAFLIIPLRSYFRKRSLLKTAYQR